ncbi:hypothetical protein [Kitasatospora purpeofusca]|uniref:hypothetical protein n=1 Tax=Kitasatospora purpeofusca TaxID=67352 RepID=UPI003806DA1B
MSSRTTRTTRTAAASGVAALVATAGLGLGAAPAHADPLPAPSTTTCDPYSSTDLFWYGLVSTKVEPVVTDFLAVAITPGTTGTRTSTLTETDSVTTTVNASAEVTADFKALFAKVTVKVGFSVSDTKSTTHSSTVTSTVNFNSPGYYGVFRGTRKVTGQYVRYVCARSGSTGYWINTTPNGPGAFTTFDIPEVGTVSCASPEPAGSLRATARARLFC